MSSLNPYFYAYNPELLAFENAWIKYLKTQEINRSVIKEEVRESWKRCHNLRLDALSKTPPQSITNEQLNQRLGQNKLILQVVDPFLHALYDIVKNSGFRVDFIDAQGYILKSMGDKGAVEICQKTNSFPGANRLEAVAGTNSIDLAIRTKKPIQIAGAEHYMQMFHRWACSSAPVLDENGEVLGVLNASGRYELIHIHTLGMVSAAAKAIENEIQIQRINQKLVENNSQLRTTLEIVTDGVIYIEQDTIMQVNKELCIFLGKTEKAVIGKNVFEEIITTPDLRKMIDNESNFYKEGEIILRGRERGYKCIFSFETVFGQDAEEIGKVMIFTRVDEIQALASKIKYTAGYTFDHIVGKSSKLRKAIEIARKASEHDTRIIIEGESGTGKEMFAQAIHNNSTRKYGPFIAVDCGTLARELLESELFGYEKGAFTGANKDGKVGLFEIANKGTVFLDEIGNMPPEMQVKILRVLQEGVITRVGGTTPIQTDVRVIAATNVDLEKAIEEGSFRQDLFYRLNVFYIKTPPLRERKEDIPLLVEHFIKTSPLKKREIKLDKKVERALQEYDWPGNIRQLNNAIERALIMAGGGTIKLEDLPYEMFQKRNGQSDVHSNEGTLENAMRDYIIYTIEKNNHNISRAAKILGISRSTIYKALKDNPQEGEPHEYNV